MVGNEKVTLAFQTAHCIHNLSSHFGSTKAVITGKPARSPQGGSVWEDPRGFWARTRAASGLSPYAGFSAADGLI